MSVDATKKAFAMIASIACMMRHMQSINAGQATIMRAIMVIKMVISKGESRSKNDNNDDKENFVMAMEPPAKKAKTAQHIIPWNPCKVVKSNNKFDTFLSEKKSFFSKSS